MIAVASATVRMLCDEAVKEIGKGFGKAVSEKAGQLTELVRAKFFKEGTEGLIVRAEQQPTDKNIEKATDELVTLLQQDTEFEGQVRTLLRELEQAGLTRQMMLSNAQFKGTLEVGDMKQTKKPGTPGDQIMASGITVEQDATFGNLTQEG
jgi:histidyl-tRNA synthetase